MEDLKKLILFKYPEYHNGYINVQKPDGQNVTMTDENQYSGIADDKGNYFYIRSLKETTYRAAQSNCRKQFYEATTTYRIVSVMHEPIIEANHELALVQCVSQAGYNVTKSVIERTRVFFEETGNREMTNNLHHLSLCYVDFTDTHVVNANNCKLQICKC